MGDWYKHGVNIDSIAVDDRALQYGDGVFETLAVRDSHPRFWDSHIRRLGDACSRLGLSMPAVNILRRDLDRALAKTTVNTTFCTAKLIISAGGNQRGYRRPSSEHANSLIGVFPSQPLPEEFYRNGVAAFPCKTAISTQSALAGIKSLNRLDQVLGRVEWDTDEFFEGLMCDADTNLVCGTMTNLFFVRNNKIETPSLNRSGVAGVMRHRIIALLAENNIDCTEVFMPMSALEDVDEMFISNTQIGVLPVREFGDHRWPAGEATQSVMALLAYNQVPECRL